LSVPKNCGWISALLIGKVIPGRHAEQELVALSLDDHAGALGLAPQLALLPIHILADRGARDRADARADRLLGPIPSAADQVAAEVAGHRADRGPDRGARLEFALARFRIGHAGAGGQKGSRQCGSGDTLGR
jgi:hypothetical protein